MPEIGESRELTSPVAVDELLAEEEQQTRDDWKENQFCSSSLELSSNAENAWEESVSKDLIISDNLLVGCGSSTLGSLRPSLQINNAAYQTQRRSTTMTTISAIGSTAYTRQGILSAAEFERYKTLYRGLKKFSLDGDKGIRYLAQQGYFGNIGGSDPSPQIIAEFLYRERDMLSKRAIGEYLGRGQPINIQVLDYFVRLQPFHHVPFDRALRQFLSTFRLPGEAQQIDRMMERFAKWYVECNPEHPLFRHSDIAYILAFSIIMLNTDLHNPAVKRKISKSRFIRNNFDVLCKTTPAVNVCTQSKTFLEYLYESIQREPLSLGGGVGSGGTDFGSADDQHLHDNPFFTFFNPEREGFLQKQGGRVRTWKRRYCIVTGGCLYYFKREVLTDTPSDSVPPNESHYGSGKKNEDQRPCGIVPLENLCIEQYRTKSLFGRERFYFKLYPSGSNTIITTLADSVKAELSLGDEDKDDKGPANDECGDVSSSPQPLVKAAKTRSDGRLVQGRHRYYLFRCASEDEQQDWIRSIQAQITQPSAAYQLYHERRKRLI